MRSKKITSVNGVNYTSIYCKHEIVRRKYKKNRVVGIKK